MGCGFWVFLVSGVPYLSTFLVPVPLRNHYEKNSLYFFLPGYFKVHFRILEFRFCFEALATRYFAELYVSP